LRLAMERTREGTPLGAWGHSVSIAWLEIAHRAEQSGFGALVKVPGFLVAGVVVAPVLLWVCFHVYRCEKRRLLSYPLLLWVVALASFVPEIANDYSLVFLPLAVVAVYSRREPLVVHAAIALWLLATQPFALPINPFVLLLFKLLGLYAVGAMLVGRARELGAAATAAVDHGPGEPAQGDASPAASASGASPGGSSEAVAAAAGNAVASRDGAFFKSARSLAMNAR